MQAVDLSRKAATMGCSQDAIRIFETHRKANVKGDGVWFAPGKAANIGGSAVSGLEMAQNSQHTSWSAELVDHELRKTYGIMFLEWSENCRGVYM